MRMSLLILPGKGILTLARKVTCIMATLIHQKKVERSEAKSANHSSYLKFLFYLVFKHTILLRTYLKAYKIFFECKLNRKILILKIFQKIMVSGSKYFTVKS